MGALPTSPIGDPEYRDDTMQRLEAEDDSYGSGIFDMGFRPTANADTGIYTSNYPLPGYIGREVPFAVSREVTDITDNADVVVVPAGGLTYAEVDGRPIDASILGPTPRPPIPRPNPNYTPRDQPYRSLTTTAWPRLPAHPSAPVRPPPTYGPARQPTRPVTSARPHMPRRLRRSPTQAMVPTRSTVNPTGARIAISGNETAEEGLGLFAWVAIGAVAGGIVGYGRKKKWF